MDVQVGYYRGVDAHVELPQEGGEGWGQAAALGGTRRGPRGVALGPKGAIPLGDLAPKEERDRTKKRDKHRGGRKEKDI